MTARAWWSRLRPRRSTGPTLTVVLRGSDDPDLDESRRRRVAASGVSCVLSPAAVVQVPPDVAGLLAFVEPGDEVQPEALAALAGRVHDGGLDVGRGAVAHRREGRTWRRLAPSVLGDAVDPREHPGVLAVADLRGMVVSARVWREVSGSDVPWDGTASAGTRSLLVAGAVVTTEDLVVVTDEADEVDLPVERRRRHRPERSSARCRAVVLAAESLSEELWAGHAAALVDGWLSGAVHDALAGRAAAMPEVAACAGVLVDHLRGAAPDSLLRVEDRLLVWVVSRGVLEDSRAAAMFLEDHPRGLPTRHGLVEGPEPTGWLAAVPEEWRRTGPADQRLAVRLLPPSLDGATWRLDGNALVTAGPGGLPTVEVDGVPLRVQAREDPSAEAWADRDHESHRGCGFRAEVDVGALPPLRGGRRAATVALQGRSVTRPVGPEGVGADLVVTGAGADGGRLHLAGGGGAAAEIRLTGPRGRSTWVATTPGDAATFSATLSLSTSLFSREVPLPAGHYVLEARHGAGTGDGRSDGPSIAWDPAVARPETRWVGERAGLQPRAPDRLVVGQPVELEEDSAYARRRRMNAWTPRGTAALGRTVVFESFAGRAVADNPLAIARELAARDLDVDVAWLVDDPSVSVPEGMRAVPRRTPEMFRVLADAAAYVSNASAPAWWRKRPGMVHLQTWHGIPLKRIGEDRGPGDFATWRHREVVAAQAAGWDALLSPSPYCSPIFRSAFRFTGRLLETGQPRNDVLLSPHRHAVRAQVRAELGLGPDDHVVLYAPTWRQHAGTREAKPVYLEVEELLASMPGTTLLVRGHYNASRQPDLALSGRVQDVTRYPDVADLLCAADALVTDYSSVMFDFCLTDRPVVLLVPDLAFYRDVHPGTYVDIETRAPGPVVADTAGVVAALRADDQYHHARARFRADFCPLDDGGSAARVVDHLSELLAW